jgi:hypothetical protein
MKKEENGTNRPAPPSRGEPEKPNPNPARYDPRQEREKTGNEERKGLNKEFGV